MCILFSYILVTETQYHKEGLLENVFVLYHKMDPGIGISVNYLGSCQLQQAFQMRNLWTFWCSRLSTYRRACETMHGQECIWDEIGGEMLSEGNKILDWYKKSNVQSTEVKMHCAVHYHLYHHYTCVMTELGGRGDHEQVPDYVEKYIKYAYPGNSKFVRFKEHPAKKHLAKKCQGKLSAAK